MSYKTSYTVSLCSYDGIVWDEALDVAERQLGLALRQIAEIEVELVRTS